jgi:hypothetical protein
MSSYKDTIEIKDTFDLVQALGLSRDKAEELLDLCRMISLLLGYSVLIPEGSKHRIVILIC